MLQKLERKDSFSHTEDGICNINFNINSGFHAKSLEETGSVMVREVIFVYTYSVNFCYYKIQPFLCVNDDIPSEKHSCFKQL